MTVKTSRHCGWRRRKFLESQAIPLKGPHRDLLRLPPSELQHGGSSLKGTRDIQGETEVFGIKESAGGAASLRQKCWQWELFFCWTLPTQTWEVVGWDIWDSTYLVHTVHLPLVIPWVLPPNFWAYPSCFQWIFQGNGLFWFMLQIFLNSLKQTWSGLSEPHTPC